MDLQQLCEEHGYTFAAVWRPARSKTPGKGEVLKCDVNASFGAFAERSVDYEFAPGEGLPGRAFASKDVESMANLQVSSDAYPVGDGGDARKDLAKELGVRGAFAIWRDGAVWEFGGTLAMEKKPEERINSFGGSTGVRGAAQAVQAVVRLGAMAKKSKANAAAADAAA